ncbi:MAG: TIGR03986 family CRISPR-associated RAMP protein [Alphaproteobacteria bacterium]|nr:TIGR03986 family CRISPR-associated RAMP protein [Alphaproteobacteria bacterium]
MTEFKLLAPYDFVPLDPFVFEPDWAERVSHDVPFADGHSGSLFLHIEALTPLFVGAGQAKPSGDRTGCTEKRAFTIGDRPAIPGTSLKGAIRNVLEIASFGRIGPMMDDIRLSLRDLHNPRDYVLKMTEKKEGGYAPKAKAGFLEIDDDGEWWLTPCDYSVVRQTDLEIHYKAAHQVHLNLGRRQSAKDKYDQLAKVPLDLRFNAGPWSVADNDFAPGRYLSRAHDLGRGTTLGRLVMTGQPQDRDKGPRKNSGKGSGKAVEFLFHSRGERRKLSAETRFTFEAVHRDPNTHRPQGSWAYWQPRLEKREAVPVFWLESQESGRQTEDGIAAMGLSMMFRLAYPMGTRSHARQNGDGLDLAAVMFGHAPDGTEGDALKGRVRCRDAICVDGDWGEWVEMPMLAPKPGFYPAYVRQQRGEQGTVDRVPVEKPPSDDGNWGNGVAGYTTFMTDGAVIRGWKRYPVSRNVRQRARPEKGGDNVMSRFRPLREGATFWTRVDFHNLRLTELGALAWAITFGARDGRYCHALGGARFAGYGCTRLTIVGADIEPNAPDEPRRNDALLWDQAIPAFTATMERAVPRGWARSPQLRELLSMADPEAESGNLGEMAGPKPFQDAKRERAFLPLHSGGVDPGQEKLPSFRSGRGGPKEGTRGRASPPAITKGSVDGEAVEILKRSGWVVTVRFVESGDIEDIDANELDG